MKKLLFTCSLVLMGYFCFAQDSAGIEVLEPEVYSSHLAEAPQQFVDIRTRDEYSAGHIKGAENIDFLAEGFLSEMLKYDKEEPLYIYCRSGNRSSKAAGQLIEMGFKKIIDLKGGFKAWKKFEEEN